MQSCLITGAGGFLGKRLCKHLAEMGIYVYALGNHIPSLQDKDYYFSSKNIQFIEIDLKDINVDKLPANIDYVYTLAQSPHFRDFPDMAEDIFSVNVHANLKILQWASEMNVRKIVHASSGGIYGEKTGSQLLENNLLPVDSPLGFYLGTKLCGEIIFQNYRHFFETAVILRPFFMYGPGQRKDMFIPRIINSVKEGKPIMLQGNNGVSVNPIYIEDAVAAFARALNLTGCHVINVAGKEVLTLRMIGMTIGSVLGKDPVFQIDENATPGNYIADIMKMSELLIEPETCFNKGIESITQL